MAAFTVQEAALSASRLDTGVVLDALFPFQPCELSLAFSWTQMKTRLVALESGNLSPHTHRKGSLVCAHCPFSVSAYILND